MPYKSEKIKLSREYDRRVKLSDEQKEEIRSKYATGCYSQRGLAAEYRVSRRLISFILDDEKAKRAAEQLKARKADGRYKPTKKEWADTMKEHRRYKQRLYMEGKLKAYECDNNFEDVLDNGKNIKMKNIAGCIEDESWTLDDCENKCPKYYGCYSVALANDILKEYEGELIKDKR